MSNDHRLFRQTKQAIELQKETRKVFAKAAYQYLKRISPAPFR
jgi:hypothetical protein